MGLFIAAMALFAAPELIVLDNGYIRVEVDPELFTVRFIGTPGGPNCVEPVHVPESARAPGEWADPGGLITDLVPFDTPDAALRRGPGEILGSAPDHLVMLSPKSEAHPLRIKKEIRLSATGAAATYRVTVLSTSTDPIRLAVRNTARVPVRSTLRVKRDDATLRSLSGAEGSAPAIVKSLAYWLIPVPPTTVMDRVIVGGFVPRIELKHQGDILIRRIVTEAATPKDLPQEASFLCLLDSPSQSYAAVFQSALEEVVAGSPLSFAEEWRLDAD